MMTLGFFVFSLKTASYQQLQRQTNWRIAKQDRIGLRPAYQALGPGEDIISLSGVLYPELTAGRITLDLLRAMAEKQDPWPLIEGTGRMYGWWAIKDIQETATAFMRDGLPQKIEFDISLVRVDDRPIDLSSVMASAAAAGLTGAAAGAMNRARDSVGRISGVLVS